MPGFKQKLEQFRAERDKTAENDAMQKAAVDHSKPTETLIEEKFREKMLPPKPVDKTEQQHDLSATSWQGEGISADQHANNEAQILAAGNDQRAADVPDEYVDPTTWSPNDVHASFLEKSAKSLVPGLGTLIGGWGDVMTGIDKLLPGSGTIILPAAGDLLKSLGDYITEENKRYIPTEMLDPEFNWATFSNPDFWSTHAAEAIPQIVEILAINALTAGTAGMVESGIKSVVTKKLAEEGAEAALKMGLKGTTNAAWKGASGIVETAGTGRGLIGKMITDQGTLTNRASEIFKGVTGGAMMNLRVSLGDAGEVYNNYKDMKAPDGSKMFNEKQLQQMSSSAFSNNMSYMAYDMLSWGMTFGGGWKKVGGFVGKASETFSPAIQRKVVGGMFSKAVSPIIENVAKWGGTAIAEGLEETIQESFEEYAKFKAYKEVAGTWKGFEGVTKDYDNYWDYYASKDSSALRAISFGAGMAIGGLANMKALVNRNADDSVKLYSRMENLKHFAKRGTEMKAAQNRFIRNTMAELVFDGKEFQFDSFMNHLVKNNGVEQDEQVAYQELFQKMVETKEEISAMNIKGKKAMMMNVTEQMTIEDKIKSEDEQSKKTIEILKKQLEGHPEELKAELEKEQDNLKNNKLILTKILQNLKDNKVKLITGQKAEAVDFEVVLDENGNEVIVPVKKDGDNEQEAPEIPKMTLQNLGTKAKELFKSIFGGKSEEDIDNADTNEAERNAEQNPVADTETELTNKMDLANISPEEDLYVDGEKVISHQINDDISTDGKPNPGGFDYQIEPAMVGGEGLTNQENINASKGSVIAPATGGFFKQDGTPVKVTKKPKVKTAPSTEAPSVNTEPKKENLNIIKDDSITEIDQDAYENFVEHGEIASGIIKTIADKIEQGSDLSTEEQAVYKEFSSDIESLLQDYTKEEQAIAEQDKSGDEKADAFVEAATKRALKRKPKNASDDKEDYKEKLSKKKIIPPSKDEDPFGDGKSRLSFEEGKEVAKSTVQSIWQKGLSAFAKRNTYLKSLKDDYSKFKGKVGNAMSFDDESDINDMRIAQQYAVNQKLALMHPESNINVLAVKNLQKVLGNSSLGYALANAIYIDENVWNQNKYFMHEMAHVYFPMFQKTAQGQAFLKFSLKNEATVKKVMDLYSDNIEYTAHYPDGSTQVFQYKNIRNSEQFKAIPEAQFQELFEEYQKTGFFTMVPLEEQSVIAEEVFVFSLEGDLDKKYDKYFNLKDEPARKFLAKSWWKNIKNRAVKADETYGEDQAEFLRLMNNNEKIEYKKAHEFIMDAFKKSVDGKDLSAAGRSRLSDEMDEQTIGRHLEIQKKLELERELYQGVNRFKEDKAFFDFVKAQEMENVLAEHLETDNENNFEYDRLKYGEKATQIIKDFAKHYNRVLQRAFYIKNKDRSVNWKNEMPIFDKDKLIVKIKSLAASTNSNIDFIDLIENSDVEEIMEFNNFLDEMRPDKLMTLSAMKFIYGNQTHTNPVKGYINSDGVFELQNNINNKELSTVDNILDKLYKASGAYFDAKAGRYASEYYVTMYERLSDSIKNVRENKATESDAFTILDFFANDNIDTQAIMDQGYLNINGKPFTINSVIHNLVNKAFTHTVRGNVMNDLSIKDKSTGQIKPIFRTMIQSVVATNKKFTADFTTNNANGKAEPTTDINNALIREIKNMERDARELGKNTFLKKYSNISKNTSEGARSNALLNYIYNEVQNGNKIELNKHNGIENDQTKKSSVIKESNDTEQSVMEFLMFLESKGKTNYLMETGRFSDSPTAYILKVPKLNIKNIGTFTNGVFTFDTDTKSALKNAYSIYQSLQGQMSMEEFMQTISNEINSELDFINDNNDVFAKIQNTTELFSGNKLNENGMQTVASYAINQVLNGLYFSEIFFPSYNVEDIVKRSKAGRSPGFSFGPHVKVEAIPFISPLNDSGVYITQKTADRIARAGGNLMKLGHSFKLLNTGVEHDNEMFQGKNIFDKGYFTVLNEAVVKQSPSLKGLHDLMQSREAKYENANGPLQEDILNGMPTQVIYAYPTSSNKSNNYPEPILNKDKTSTELGQRFELEQINNGNFDEINETLDNWYWKNDEFIGLSGDNFVVQQVMDKEVHSSNVSVQMMRAVLTNAGANGNLKVAEEIQQHISNQQQTNFQEYRNVINNGTQEEIREFLIKNMLIEDVDPTQRFALINDKLSLTVPILREIAKNTFANTARRTGNKLQVDGTIARAKTPTYEKAEGYTNGSKGLAFYTKNSDGSHNKGEAILPKNKEGKIRKREYLMFSKIQAENNPEVQALFEERAKNKAKGFKVEYGKVTDEFGNLTGYYVEGETIIATRIPSHGPQTTGVFEVVDFDATEATDIMLPNEFARDITGGDFDGDQYFVQNKGGVKQGEWNKAFDKLTKLWLSKEMANEVVLPIDFEEDAKKANEAIEEVYGKKEERIIPSSPRGRRKAFENTLISKGNIGITANLHSLLGMMSAYETELMTPITINGKTADRFKDAIGSSRTIESAKIFNIIMDNSTWHFADKLGINQHTASSVMILSNLGYNLSEIGLLMNSDVVKEMNRLMSKSDNVFGDKIPVQEIEKQVRANLKLPEGKGNSKSINLKSRTPENSLNILRLMTQLATINEEVMKFSAIMQGHSTLEVNPFILRQQMIDFQSVMSNKENKGLKMPSGLYQNPMVQNYVSIFDFNLKMQQKMDPVYKTDLIDVFDNVFNGLGRTANNKILKLIHNDIEINNTARMLGLNNVDVNYLNNLTNGSIANKDSIFYKMQELKNKMSLDIIERNKKNPRKSISALDNNLMLSKGLRMSLYGKTQYISLNPSYFNNTLTDGERERMLSEFEALPNELKNDLMLYDLVTTGMKGPQSLFHLYNEKLKQRISKLSDLNSTNNSNELNSQQKVELAERTIQQNPQILIKYESTKKNTNGKLIESPFVKNDYNNEPSLSDDFVSRYKGLMRSIKEGKDTYFSFVENGKTMIAHFTGWTNEDIGVFKSINPKDLQQVYADIAHKNITFFEANKYNNKVGVVAIPDAKTGKPLNYDNSKEIDWENLGK